MQTRYERTLRVWVDRERARFSSWYEMFPRSWRRSRESMARCAMLPRSSTTSRRWDSTCCICRRFIPSGAAFARARTIRRTAEPGDVGSPWAIGAKEGGHTRDPSGAGHVCGLRAPDRTASTRARWKSRWILPFSARPDHPWVKEHPEWFKKRADGSIQYAENPPKKYQDIYPLDFESQRLAGAVGCAEGCLPLLGGAGRAHLPRGQSAHQGISFLGVGDSRRSSAVYPDAIFLAEAFTRPRVMERLAKLGFTQSLHLLHLAEHEGRS